jgi:hypothetical protein
MSIHVSKDTQLKRARLYPEVVRLPLDEARVCLNCDTIHTGDCCPVCASANYLILSSVIGRLPQNYRFQKDATSGTSS